MHSRLPSKAFAACFAVVWYQTSVVLNSNKLSNNIAFAEIERIYHSLVAKCTRLLDALSLLLL